MIHVRDIDAEPEASDCIRNMGPKSFLWMPLLRDDAAIGIVAIDAKAPGASPTAR